jgi:hypothetical protein
MNLKHVNNRIWSSICRDKVRFGRMKAVRTVRVPYKLSELFRMGCGTVGSPPGRIAQQADTGVHLAQGSRKLHSVVRLSAYVNVRHSSVRRLLGS